MTDRNDMVDHMIDLGDASTETRGGAPVGIYDSATNQYFLSVGIDQED